MGKRLPDLKFAVSKETANKDSWMQQEQSSDSVKEFRKVKEIIHLQIRSDYAWKITMRSLLGDGNDKGTYSSRTIESNLGGGKLTQNAGNLSIQKNWGFWILCLVFDQCWGESIWAHGPSYVIHGNAFDHWISWRRIGSFYLEFWGSTPSRPPCHTSYSQCFFFFFLWSYTF